MNSVSETVYKCMKCGALYYSLENAETCCGPKLCTECNKPIPYYKDICEKCWEKQNFEKAKKISWKDYKGSFVYDYLGEEYYDDIDSLLEHYEENNEEPPKYCYACSGKSYALDVYSVIENEIVDLCEDYEDVINDLVDLDKLEKFVEEWNKKQKAMCYEYDLKTVIMLEKE